MLIRPQSVGLISDKPITSTNYLRVCENAAWPYSSTAKLHASLSFHGGAHLVLNAQGQARQPHSRVQALDSVACLAARSSHTPQNIAIRWSREEERAWTRQVVDPSSFLLLGSVASGSCGPASSRPASSTLPPSMGPPAARPPRHAA